MESREDLIKNHYMARIMELTSQLQLADSKSVHFYAEVSGELILFGGFSQSRHELGHCPCLLLFSGREMSVSLYPCEFGWSSH